MSNSVKEMKQLIGKTIIEAGIDGESGFPWIMFDDGTAVEVSSDDEGNGPGTLFIEASS